MSNKYIDGRGALLVYAVCGNKATKASSAFKIGNPDRHRQISQALI
jgi:hypothetical protein